MSLEGIFYEVGLTFGGVNLISTSPESLSQFQP